MIINTITLRGLPQKRKEIIQTVIGLVEQIALEESCDYAEFYQDVYDKDVFYLLEGWKTMADLEKHKKSRSYAVLFGLEALLAESLEIKHAVKCRKSGNEM